MAEQHQVFIANSPTGWTNNELGLAWLQQVFNRYTAAKARRRWRLLIFDGHGSHLTAEFIDFCDANRILLVIYPPHSTHSLQPLDVVLFSPLSRNYTSELNRNLQRSQGIMRVTKREFYSIFWAAWSCDGDSWIQLRKVFDAAVADRAKVEAKQLSQSLHSLQVNNELLRVENRDLRDELNTKNKRPTRSTTLATQDSNKANGGAVFLSPRKLREARAREATKRHEAEREQLQKSHDRDLKAVATLYKKQQSDLTKATRLRAKEERDQAKKQRAAELAERRALKKAATRRCNRTKISRYKQYT
ncbi:DDE-1 domain containing protein [Pyrenophora tritici-repentis]|nr:DDE-1 domain containing protein [Pyrenophora tritici-repentis]